MKVKVSNAWKDGVPWVKVGGSWKKAVAEWIKVGGTWKKVAYAISHVSINTTMEQFKPSNQNYIFRAEDSEAFHMTPPEYPLYLFEPIATSDKYNINTYRSAGIKFTFDNTAAGREEKARLLAALQSNTAYVRFKASPTNFIDLNGANCRFATGDATYFQMNANAISTVAKLMRTAATNGECFVEIVYKD